jgi:hypothetical protein
MAMSRQSIQANAGQEGGWNELQLVLHGEVSRLPKRLRVPVILSYLEGKTSAEIAKLLRWRVGTVDRRLSRAGEVLRSRLLRRGMARSASFLGAARSRRVVFAEVVPAELVNRTVQLVSRFFPHTQAAGPTARSEGVSYDCERLDFPGDGHPERS